MARTSSIRPLILASASPRRQQLLSSAGFVFEVVPSNAEEEWIPGEDPARAAERLARVKADEVFARRPHALVLAADTVVAIGDRILGKPQDPAEAVEMLALLSGRSHRVITGVCLLGPRREEVFHASTEVIFRRLGPEEIRAYVDSGEPMDKAGAYAIQGGAAGFVREIHGSYTNVVGLPLAECIERLREGAHRRG